ncbi:MAG: hypothetical protein ACYDHH_26755 [Solirubrobacteraceae bacterium]
MSWLAELWGKRLGSRDRVDLRNEPGIIRELLAAWTPHGLELDVLAGSELVRDPVDGLIVNFAANFVLTSADVEDHGSIERRLLLDAGVAKHIRLELPEHSQRQRKGRHMLGASVRTYQALGLTRVSLSAVDVGRYVWAACGFSFDSEPDRAPVIARLAALAAEWDVPIPGLDWETAEPFDIAYAESSDPIPLRDWLELLDEPADYPEETLNAPVTRPGKLFLLSSQTPSWGGSLEIAPGNKTVGYELMSIYTGLKR